MTDFFGFPAQAQQQEWMATFPPLPLMPLSPPPPQQQHQQQQHQQQHQQQQAPQQSAVPDLSDSTASAPKRRGRKAVNAEPATKRIAQVRSAARAYRERKENPTRYVADLETTVKQLQSAGNVSEMTERLRHLEAENSVLRQMAFAFAPLQNFQQPSPISPLAFPSQTHGSSVHIAPSSLSSDSPDDTTGSLEEYLFNAPLSFPAASFKQTHSNIDYSAVQPELASLLDAPLVDPPQGKDLIVSMFQPSKAKLKAIPSLILEGELIDELFDCYVTFVSFRTDETTPVTCTATYGKIQVLQGKLIDKCMLCPKDLDTVMRLFVAIKHEFLIEVYPHEHLPQGNCKREPHARDLMEEDAMAASAAPERPRVGRKRKVGCGRCVPFRRRAVWRPRQDSHRVLPSGRCAYRLARLQELAGATVSISENIPFVRHSLVLKRHTTRSAFRERKQAYIKSLEDEVADLRSRMAILVADNERLLATSRAASTSPATVEAGLFGSWNQPAIASTAAKAATAGLDSTSVIDALKARVMALEAENSMMRQTSVAVDFSSREVHSLVPQPRTATDTDAKCVNCSIEKIRALICMGHVKSLEGVHQIVLSSLRTCVLDKITSLELECQTLRLISGSNQSWNTFNPEILMLDAFAGANLTFSTPSADSVAPPNSPPKTQPSMRAGPEPTEQLSAVQKYGPVEIEFPKIGLLSLPSLKDCKYVNKLFETFVKQANATSAETLKALMLKSIGLRHKIVDRCSIIDRQKVVLNDVIRSLMDSLKLLDIMTVFFERNRDHVAHRDRILYDALKKSVKAKKRRLDETPTPNPEAANRLKKFKETILSIKGLESTGNLLSLLDDAILIEARTREEKEDNVLQIIHVVKELNRKCQSSAERMRVSWAIESFRGTNRWFLDSFSLEDTDDEGDTKYSP
ncbi:hypothetical protein HDU84_007242 [Entophlyctis sp. JEL0112]|nr:hypothetical protein HDU84_007242 [Entophlyctis sp. JEL0112]